MTKKETIKEIREKLATDTYSPSEWEAYQKDNRKGVQDLVSKQKKKDKEKQQQKDQFEHMLIWEKNLWNKGYTYIAGIDEAGRGPLAGPVVAGAVIIDESFYIEGLDDSKKLPESTRERFFDEIKEKAVGFGIGIVDSQTIDQINIYQATKLAMKKAVMDIKNDPQYLLIDAVKLPELPVHQESLVKGDQKSVSIAAASVLAKVTRDRMMKDIDREYPSYQFASNMGYGTKVHLEALKQNGPTPFHRRSFTPVKEAMKS
ncbi:RNase HII [Salinibacillus kushneri]|uniref:Ribonuclease HII n=1 Tax=Salinibacillus kushneri TaxID=237682 RepID=A0A1I0HHT3_9BACI|nr:ribonuclease HII [Salinibacillus kushneri]SET83427.1 RNase HII [Salinibacillus kushneri]